MKRTRSPGASLRATSGGEVDQAAAVTVSEAEAWRSAAAAAAAAARVPPSSATASAAKGDDGGGGACVCCAGGSAIFAALFRGARHARTTRRSLEERAARGDWVFFSCAAYE